jgi:hypothetical protein
VRRLGPLKRTISRAYAAAYALLCAGLLVIAVTSVWIVVTGYRSERFAGPIDPVRVGLILSFTAFSVGLFIVAAVNVLEARRAHRLQRSWFALMPLGLGISSASSTLIFLFWPPGSGPWHPTGVLLAGVRVGLGLVVIVLVRQAAERTLQAIRDREYEVLVAVAVLLAVVILLIQNRG